MQAAAPIPQAVPQAPAAPAMPAAVPVPGQVPMPGQQMMMMPGQQPQFAAGGVPGMPAMPGMMPGMVMPKPNWFKSLNWIEVGFMILGGIAIFHVIDYCRYKIVNEPLAVNDTKRTIDEVKANLQSKMGKQYKAFAG